MKKDEINVKSPFNSKNNRIKPNCWHDDKEGYLNFNLLACHQRISKKDVFKKWKGVEDSCLSDADPLL